MAKLWILFALLATLAISMPAMAVYNWDGFPIHREATDMQRIATASHLTISNKE